MATPPEIPPPSNAVLAKAMAHPVQSRIITGLTHGVPQSASQLAEQISVPVRSVRHQLSRLDADGLIATAASREKRGALEKFYEIRTPTVLDVADYEQMSPGLARLVTAESFRPMVADLERAIAAGSFMWNDSSVLRVGPEVDEAGWIAIAQIMRRAYEDIRAAGGRAASRLAQSGEPPKRALSGLLWFERARPADPEGGPKLSDLRPARRLFLRDGAYRQERSASMGALAAAMGHPVKAGILSALADGYPLRVDQIARRIRIGVGRVRYHSARLVQEGLIQELGGPQRGQKLYALVIIPILWPQDLDSLGAEETDKVFAEIFRRILIDVAGAISAGTFYRRPDFCQIRLPLAVDQEGWDEIQDLHIGLFEEVDSVHIKAVARLKRGREEPISATAGIVWVELPPTPTPEVR